MAMAILPEEFPVVLTVFLALGAWRISRSHVLTRRMPAIETLGAATVLCTDKTGTLTQNRMRVAMLNVQGQDVPVPEGTTQLAVAAIALVQLAARASRAQPFDPMERAIVALRDALVPGEAVAGVAPPVPVREYPLAAALTAVSQAWPGAEPGSFRIASKGSPEAIADLCHLDAPARARLDADVARLAGAGLRVLAVAEGEQLGELPAAHHDLELHLAGLLCLADPLREDVPAAVAECQAAGIRVIMITGDYPATALAIARQAGLQGATHALTGPELEAMDDDALASAIAGVQVFARVVPEQKLRIVNALKANREVVAMTGDGVNDAPALKAAHIGIAMGGRGTDVARESASLVLLDDSFASIAAAVRLGRRIYDNIRKASMFILAVHVPIAGLSMVPVFIPGWPLLLLPVHIVFLELVIDPACSLVFEAEEAEADVMARPPRSPSQGLFQARMVLVALLQGVCALLACLGTFMLARTGQGDDAARALAFCALVAATLAIIIVNRSWSRSLAAMARVRNVALWWVLAGACTFLALALYLPPLRRLFDFAPVHAGDLALGLAAGAGSVLVLELFRGPMARARSRIPASQHANGVAAAP
jgi:Ca2+-transporting ATPase